MVERSSLHGGVSVEYVCENVTLSGNIGKNKISLVYLLNSPDGSSNLQVGGVDVIGNSCIGYFNEESDSWFGLEEGQVANTTNGRWIGWYDANNNGKYGVYDKKTGLVSYEEGELVPTEKISVEGFESFSISSGECSIRRIEVAL
jgi:hypothetical protein